MRLIRHARRAGATVQALLLLTLLAASLPQAPAVAQDSPGAVEIFALSNRADLVSDGDVLLEVRLPAGSDPAGMRVDIDGRDVTAAFAVRADGRLLGIVDGLALGANTVTATLADGRGARLAVTNHQRGGSIFSGPQIQPWYCLPDALDAQCTRPTAVTWMYRQNDADGGFAAYDPENPPSDVATTTTDEGEEVPYIVRVETGSMNRGTYRIAVLATPQEQWERWTGPPAWNHKVLVPHGAGCNSGHSEGVAPQVMLHHALSRGFLVMSHALEDNSENCNLVVQAESVMMLKEHVVEDYGDIRYQMGVGCSGGSIAQLHMANAYPGLYDGLIVGCTYPDVPVNDLLDCQVLLRYFTNPAMWAPGVVWTEQQMARASGLQSFSVCAAWAVSYSGIFDPDGAGGCDVPDREPERLYNAETNPAGVRCSYQDYAVNVLGTRPPERWGEIEQRIGQGFANRPYDNVGLIYGLRAWQNGDITTAQFVDLNAKAGGVGLDYETVPTRIEGDPAGIVNAYRAGQMNEAHELDRVPIIDIPIPGDRYEFHDNYKSWALELRLIEANGHGDNHVIWYGPNEEGQVFNPLNIHGDTVPFLAMDRWLTAIEADERDVPIEQKVVDNRPEDVTDRCEAPDEATCDFLFGSGGNIRWGAGMATVANDVIKCTLKPFERNEFVPQHFTDEEWARLQAAFPDGVCDWSQPGVGQQPSVTWQTYQDGPGGRPLGPAPVSVPFGPQPEGIQIVRHGGPGRVETAGLISSDGLTSAETVVLARADAFADALAGAPLASTLDAPLLLTRSDGLSPVAAEEIRRLGATEVVLLGGTAALAPQVEEELAGLGVTTRRIAGADRYATAAAIASQVAPAGVATALVARGDAFPDALAASALAALLRAPVLLVEPDRIPGVTSDAIAGASNVLVVGGETAISDAVAATVDDLAEDVRRLAGDSRYATSVAVAQEALGRGASSGIGWVATGADFPDALVAGAAAARDRGVLVLVDGTDLDASPEARDFLASADLIRIDIAGGTAAISQSVEAALYELLAG